MSFREISPKELGVNPFEAIGEKWMLVSAGDGKKCNTMTASWGGVGVLWNKNVSFVFVRPQRYTREFLEARETYSLSFFLSGRREELNLCGTKSGRDVDKIAACGFTTEFLDGAPYFAEADLVLICRKLYRQDMTAGSFLEEALVKKCYPDGDFHRVYVGEILHVLERE